MADSARSSRCLIAVLILLWPVSQAPLRASPAKSDRLTEQAPPVEDPKIKIRTQEGNLDWSPLAPGKTRNPTPEAKRLLLGLARGEAKDLEEIIRTSYRLTSAYARNEGHAIAFELSDFRTLYTPEALRLKYGEIVTLGVPDRIAITGVSRDHTLRDREGHTMSEEHRRGFAAKWEPNPPVPDRALWEKRSMSEIIEMGQELQPELARLRAVTSYRVAVMFEGVRRSYRAAFVWMSGVATSKIERFECWEPVANRVGLVLLEETQPEAEIDNSTEKPRGLESITQPAVFGTCEVYSRYASTSPSERVGVDRHLSGYYHRSSSQMALSCHCSSYCESICRPSLAFAACEDTGGTTGGFHVVGTDFKTQAGSILDAVGGLGASCSGTYACAFAQCLTPNCLFQVSANAAGGFSSSPAGAAFWGFAPTTSTTCGGCTEREREETPDPDVPEEDNCPLLIALDGRHLELTNLAGGVRFDLDRDGNAERLSWTEPGSSWAFVGLDINRNGRIDHGGELFGNYTDQSLDVENPNGYAALAEYDKPVNGGNGDGRIDARDPIYVSLLLWVDSNHDGISQAGEIGPLAQRVEAVGLDYHESHARDRYGNQFRYRGSVWLASGQKSHSVDVFLLKQ